MFAIYLYLEHCRTIPSTHIVSLYKNLLNLLTNESQSTEKVKNELDMKVKHRLGTVRMRDGT